MKEMTLAETVSAVAAKVQLTAGDLKKVKAIREAIDITKLEQDAAKRVTTRNWKKGDRAPNGVLLEDHYQELRDGGLAYFVSIDGIPTIFQVSDARDGSLLTKATLEEAKAAHVEMIVEGLVNEAIPDIILEKMAEEA